MTVQIDVKRTGFPVKIGALELWFDSSLENLRNFFNVDEIAQERLKKAEEKAQHVHFPTNSDDVDLEEMDIKTIDAGFDLGKEFIATQYDIIFGDGTFKRIYKEYPDVLALEQALEPLGLAIAKKIDEQEKERSAKVDERIKEALAKLKEKQE